ncbi:MAG: hypothetical protein DME16_21285 [Candidatus Rokuibacteriota bacterium]|nr:MAG: hypothetical protein DME16_21285 [Candidatus Rokubacteria bacterium]
MKLAAAHGDGAIALGLLHRLLRDGVEAGAEQQGQGGKAAEESLAGAELHHHAGLLWCERVEP